MTKLKNTMYEDKEMYDITKKFYLRKRNLIISFPFVPARTFDRARTITRTIDRDYVRGDYNDLKFCRRIFLSSRKKCNVYEFFISGEEKINEFFISIKEKNE